MAKIEKKVARNEKEQKNKEQTLIKDIPKLNDLTKEEILEIYKDELKRKDEIIDKLERENNILLNLTLKNTKRRLEESETTKKIEKK